MAHVASNCCAFHLGRLSVADAYCYVCGTVHRHEHLDLRSFRETFLGRVVRRHPLIWSEIRKDERKFSGMRSGVICESVATEIEALCEHRNPIFLDGKPLRLHMCFGQDVDLGDGTSSIEQGLDFTTDICSKRAFAEADSDDSELGQELQEAVNSTADRFRVGDVVRYDPRKVTFVLA